jgi:hypothetical protein
MGRNHSGWPLVTQGATPGWYRLAYPGEKIQISFYVASGPDGVPRVENAGYKTHKNPVINCPYCGLPRMDDVYVWNRHPRAEYCTGDHKDWYHRRNNETGLRGEEAQTAHRQSWRYSVIVEWSQATGAPMPRRRRKRGDEV